MHRRKLRWPAVGLVAVLLVGGGTAYAVASGDSVPRYRIVAAGTGDIEQTLASSGTVDAANRADVGFGVDGTIARMKVAVGDTVKAGQALAELQTGELDAAVTEAEAAVAQAVAQLASDKAAQNDAVENAADTPAGTSGTPSSNGDAAATAATLKALKALQEKVIAAQSTASAALAAAKSALAAQTEACADAFTTPTADPTADLTADPTADPSGAPDDDSAACTAALAEVQAKQQDVADAQDALAKALGELTAALNKALGGVTRGGNSPQTGNARTTPSSETPSTDGASSAGGTVTAARLAADQAQIEQARADLVTARQARDQATLRATRSGKVVALAAGKGDSVSAGDPVVTIVGGKAITVTGSVSEEKVDQVRVGQKVRVTVPGSDEPADGTVTAIGLVADSSSGTTSYPVTVTVEDPSIALPTGSSALLQIVLSTVTEVVTVPTSAVTRRGDGDAATVRTWDGTKLSTKSVTLGAAGTRTVQVTSGLKAGDEVVLAAIDDPIDGASSELNQRGGFGGMPVAQFRGAAPGGGGPQIYRSGK
ncbi:efflux RND transporter periplasmic adaptor subunit [Nocardioides marmoriginsengisoli]|nr:efflux RND transporter periplasmic adaptor subunit [Nocardioides marmoriginsengisoli]